VHDSTGCDEAPTVIAAYMLMSAKAQGKTLTLVQALNFLNGKKNTIQLSKACMKQLSELEEQLFGESTIQVRAGGRGNKGRGRGRGKRK